MGRWHSQAARRAGATILGVVDADESSARRLAHSLGVPYAASLGEIAPGQSIDVVHICTPVGSHAALMEAALERNCHVVCEKPLVATLTELHPLLERARRLGKRIYPVHQFPFQAGSAWLRGNLASLGDLRRVDFSFCTAGADAPARMGASQLVLEMLPHPLSMLRAVGIAVSALAWRTTIADRGEVQFDAMADRTFIRVSVSVSARPTEASAVFYGTRSTVRLDFFHGFAQRKAGIPGRRDKLARPFLDGMQLLAAASGNLARRCIEREWAYPGLANLLAEVYDSLEADRDSPIDDAETLDIYGVVDILRRQLEAAP
jgi:predicted dehydrogenase